MIIDTIKNITKYEASFPWLKRIGAILESPTLASLSDGAYQTDDASIVYAISSYITHEKGLYGYETHLHHADVQVLLSGHENIDIAQCESLHTRSTYDSQKDIQFFDGVLSSRWFAEAGQFIVLLPGEAHEPCLVSAGEEPVRKLVFKIACS